jgi:hypothetical protein
VLCSYVFIEAHPRRTSAFFSSLPPVSRPLLGPPAPALSERVASTPRSLVSLPFALPVFLPTIHHPLTTAHCSFNSFPVNSFADPHPLSPLESYCFKKGGGRGAPLGLRLSNVRPPVEAALPFGFGDPDLVGTSQRTCILTPLSATLMRHPASVANKRLTAWLNLLDATLTKNTGGRGRCHSRALRASRSTSSKPNVFFPLWNGVGDRTYPCAIIGFAACASAKKASRE